MAQKTNRPKTDRFADFGKDALSSHAVIALLSRIDNVSNIQLRDYCDTSIVEYQSTVPLFGVVDAIAIVLTPANDESEYAPSDGTICAVIAKHMEAQPPTSKRLIDVSFICLSPIAVDVKARVGSAVDGAARSIAWICGEDLYNLFEQFYPEFLIDEARALRSHIAQLAVTAQDTTPVTKFALFSGHQSSHPKDPSFFVDLTLQLRFHTYDSGDRLSPLPSEERLTGSWSQLERQQIVDEIVPLKKILYRAQEWGYIRPGVDIDAIMNVLVDFNRRFSKLVEADYQDQKRLYESEFSTYNSMTARLKAVTKKPREPRYAITSPDRIKEAIALRRTVQEAVSNVIAPISKEIREPRFKKIFSQGVPSATSRVRSVDADKLLSSVDIIEACRFGEFARGLPDSSFRTMSKVLVKMPPGLLTHTSASMLIVGGPGSGKSSYCRWNALNDAKQLAIKGSDVLPVLVPLHLITTVKVSSFAEVFLKTAGVSGLLPTGHSDVSHEAKIRLYLDGLDEVPGNKLRKEIIDLAISGKNKFKNIQIIITSRDHIGEPWLDVFPRLELGGLSAEQMSELAGKWLGSIGAKFVHEVQRNRTLANVVTIPLLATLTILVFKHREHLPDNRVGLYRMFSDLLSGGWNLAKGIQRPIEYSQDLKLRILSRFAYSAHEKRKREVSIRILTSSIDHEVGKNIDAAALRNELFADGLIEKTVGGIQFRHLSFQEYLSARYLASDTNGQEFESKLRDFLKNKENSAWWEEVLRFYCEMSNRPIELANKLADIGNECFDLSRSQIAIEWMRSAFPEANICSDREIWKGRSLRRR